MAHARIPIGVPLVEPSPPTAVLPDDPRAVLRIARSHAADAVGSLRRQAADLERAAAYAQEALDAGDWWRLRELGMISRPFTEAVVQAERDVAATQHDAAAAES